MLYCLLLYSEMQVRLGWLRMELANLWWEEWGRNMGRDRGREEKRGG